MPASSNPRSPGRYLPVRFPADALAAAQSVAKGVKDIGAAALDSSEAANRMRLETERRQEQADKLGGVNNLDEWHATFNSSLLTDQNPLGYEKRFNKESEAKIQEILSAIPQERRGNLEESLRDRQSNYRVNAISQAAVMANRYATRNFEAAYKLAGEQKNYGRQHELVEQNPQLTMPEKQYEHTAIDRVANTKRIENLCYQDPLSVIKSINAGELDGNYTPEQQEKFFQLADQNASKKDIILNTPNKGRAGGIMAAASGEFSKGEIELEDEKSKTGKYNFDKAFALAREEAEAAPAMKDKTPEMETWAETFYNKYEKYGLNRGQLSGLANGVRSKFDRKTQAWNPKDAADLLQSNNWFNSPGLWQNENPTDSQGRAGRQVGADGKIYKTDDLDFPGYNGNKKEVLVELAKNEAKENRRKTDEAFDSWKLTEEGMSASMLAQQMQYADIVSKIVGKKIPFDFQPAADIDARMDAVNRAGESKQNDKSAKWQEKQKQNEANQEKVFQNVAIGIEQASTPGNGIIVPKAMMPKDAKEGMMACIEIGKDKFVRIPIIGTTDGEEALFTQDTAAAMRMRRGGRVLGSKIQVRAKDEEEKKYYPETELVVPDLTNNGMPWYDPSDPNEFGLLPPVPIETATPMSKIKNK